jgi:hypothetical protein
MMLGVLVVSSCGGGSNQASETSEVATKKSFESVIAGWDWEPSESLNTFRSLDVPVIEWFGSSKRNDQGTILEMGGRKLCDDLYSLSDFAAGSDQVQPLFVKHGYFDNWSEDLPLLKGKLGVIVEYVIFQESNGGPSQVISNYDRFQASHELPCKGKWAMYDTEELKSCRIPAVPGYDSECASKLKAPYDSYPYETVFALKSDFESLSGKTPNISAISSSAYSTTRGPEKVITLDNLVYLPVIDRAVLLSVKVFDESNSFKTIELNERAMDLAFAIWDDFEANLTAYYITYGG